MAQKTDYSEKYGRNLGRRIRYLQKKLLATVPYDNWSVGGDFSSSRGDTRRKESSLEAECIEK